MYLNRYTKCDWTVIPNVAEPLYWMWLNRYIECDLTVILIVAEPLYWMWLNRYTERGWTVILNVAEPLHRMCLNHYIECGWTVILSVAETCDHLGFVCSKWLNTYIRNAQTTSSTSLLVSEFFFKGVSHPTLWRVYISLRVQGFLCYQMAHYPDYITFFSLATVTLIHFTPFLLRFPFSIIILQKSRLVLRSVLHEIAVSPYVLHSIICYAVGYVPIQPAYVAPRMNSTDNLGVT